MNGHEPVIIFVIVMSAMVGTTLFMLYTLRRFNERISFWALHRMISRMSLGITPKGYKLLDDHDKKMADASFVFFKRTTYVSLIAAFVFIYIF